LGTAILTPILGPLMEWGLRLSLEMSRDDFSIHFTSSLSAIMRCIICIIFGVSGQRGQYGNREG